MVRKRKSRLKRAFKALSFIAIGSLVVGAGAVGYIYYTFTRDLPDVSSLGRYEPSLVTRLYDNSDQLIAEYYVEKRILVPLSKIPMTLRTATIAVEDVSFYEHHGLNLEGIVRAFFANLKAGRVVQGGSSITQQVAKRLLLTPERTFTRKIKEAILSIEIDRKYTKDEILGLYLNHVYYGHGAYGVEAAAQTYFGKHLGELTVAEMALIAGLPKAPNNYSPYNNEKRAKLRRTHVLNRLVAVEAITPSQRETIMDEPFRLAGRKKPKNKAPWFAEHVRRYLEKKYGATKLYRGGLTVRTTLDLSLQRYAREAVRAGLEKDDKRLGYRGPVGFVDIDGGEVIEWSKLNPPRGWSGDETPLYSQGSKLKGLVLTVDRRKVDIGFENARGRISIRNMSWAHKVNPKKNALFSTRIRDARRVLKRGDIVEVRILKGKPYDDGSLPLALEQIPAVQGALLATDPRTGYILAMIGGYNPKTSKFNRAVQALRQPGSSFKPIIYTAALEYGFTPASIIIDSPIIFDRALTEFKGWKPMNFEEKFFGPTTIRNAVTHSRNIVTIKALKKIGIRFVLDYASRFGITSKLEPNLSLALGASPVTLQEMVTAYGVLANGGVKAKSMFIKSVEDRNGEILEKNEPESSPVIAPDIAFMMTDIMKNVVREGTARSLKLNYPIAGKTGTTNNNIDAWFIGFTPDIVCGVWVGRDDNTPLGKRETGARAAIPLWKGFMKKALEGSPVRDFPVPENIIFVRVDKNSGLLTKSKDENAIFVAFSDGAEPTKFIGDESDTDGEGADNRKGL